jgi:hypothetical protein
MNEIIEEERLSANDMLMAKTMGDVLQVAYPGHAWMVHVNGRQGIAVIRNMTLSANWGYLIRLPEMHSASWLDEQAKKAGGEILERFRMARGRFDGEKWAALPVDITGSPVGDKG